jgi:hypothetical protein
VDHIELVSPILSIGGQGAHVFSFPDKFCGVFYKKLGTFRFFFFLVSIPKHLLSFWEKFAKFFDITKLKIKRKTLMLITISHKQQKENNLMGFS